MNAPSYTGCPVERAVFWGSTRLSADAVEDQLSLFERIGGPEAIAAHCDLYAAHMKAGGIPRCSALRGSAALAMVA